jgi:hypothetical protein
MDQTPAAKKIRRPFAMPAAEGGGRWPGPIIERDGDRCYRGAPWFPVCDCGVVETGGEPLIITPGTNSGTGVEIASLHVNTRRAGGWFTGFMEFLESSVRTVFRRFLSLVG